MADRHKRRPRAVRLGELEDQVVAYAGEHDRTVNSVIVEAVRTFLSGPAKPADDMTAVRLGGRRKIEPITVKPKIMGYSKEQQTRGKR